MGLPLIKFFAGKGYPVKASSRSPSRLLKISSSKAEFFMIDIDTLPDNIQNFLKSTILIINIPSKNINAFTCLIKEIEKSEVKNILFVSSTSVYKSLNKSITESEGMESVQSPLFKIEKLFRKNKSFKTTILRFGGLIGGSRNPANFFNQKKSIQNPNSNVNLIHQDDCLAIINQVIEQNAWGDVFNCCADTHPTKREFYTQASIKSGYTAPAINETSQTSFKIISNAKIKRVLNYKFIHADLMDTM